MGGDGTAGGDSVTIAPADWTGLLIRSTGGTANAIYGGDGGDGARAAAGCFARPHSPIPSTWTLPLSPVS